MRSRLTSSDIRSSLSRLILRKSSLSARGPVLKSTTGCLYQPRRIISPALKTRGQQSCSQLRSLPIGHSDSFRTAFSKFGDKDTLDVAWIEIDPESARRCNLDALPVSAIEPNPTLAFDNSMMYIVAGFPAENVTISKKGGDSYLHCVLSLFITIPGKQDQSDGGLFFEYPDDPISFGDLPVPDPAGLSGGTVWAAPMASDSPIFVPDFKIVGVITHFWPKTRRIRCERFGNWLELLMTDKAELGGQIEPILRTRPQTLKSLPER